MRFEHTDAFTAAEIFIDMRRVEAVYPEPEPGRLTVQMFSGNEHSIKADIASFLIKWAAFRQ
jgi:hypothetical protein